MENVSLSGQIWFWFLAVFCVIGGIPLFLLLALDIPSPKWYHIKKRYEDEGVGGFFR
jgi:hypothetical protein